MARKKDLAGLASLAGLAYLASREKGGEAAAPTAAAEEETAVASPVRSGESETTELDRAADVPRSRPVAASPMRTSRAAAPAKPMGGSGRGGQGGATAEELAAYSASKKKPQYQSLQDRARGYEEERAKSGAPGMYGTRRSVSREPLPTAEDMAYKKGGSVKGWGAARGARKAKIY